MRAELDHIAAPNAALAFAAGCLRTAVAQRAGDHATRQGWGRALVVIIGLLCAAFHLGCALSGIEVLHGGRLDPMAAQLTGDGSGPAVLAAYIDVRPSMVLLIAALGITHIVVAWQAWRGRLRAFFAAWLIGTVLAIMLSGCILIFARTTSGIMLQMAGLLAQAAAVLWLADPSPMEAGTVASGE